MAMFGRGGNGRERSAAEREAARLERERRRALREGRTPPPAPSEPPRDEPRAAEPPRDEPRAAPEAASHDDFDAPRSRAAERSEFDAPQSPGDEPLAEEWLDEQPSLRDEPQPSEQPPADPVEEEWVEPQPTQQWSAESHDDASLDEQHPATEQWSAEPQQEADAWGWEDQDPTQTPAPVAVSAGRRGAGDDDEAEDDLDQPTVAFTVEEEQAATTPPPAPASDRPIGGHPGRRTVQLPRAHGESFDDEGHDEEPIGTRRGGRPYEPQPGAPSPGHRQLTVPRRGGRRRLAAAALFVLLLLVGAGAFFGYKLVQPGKGEGSGSVRVVIPQGATASQIGDRLAEAGVVDSGFFFDLRTRLSGHRADLRAGAYTLKRDMSYAAAIDALTTAPKAVPVLNATLPEGPSRRELAPLVRQAGVRGNYLKATARSSKLDPRAYGAPRGTRTLEGFLFPATYELRRSQATAENLVDRQIAAFKENIKKVDFGYSKSRNLTKYEVLVIASMIEREARIPRERRLVAAVIYNRLRQGIPLGIDATIRYYERNWSRPLRVSELERDSPYNTRMHQGLPPTPIGNPGLESIRAAAAPAKADHLYYVVKPCGNGAHSFSSTDAQFQRDVAAYNRKRDELGGKDPSTCKK